MKYPENRFYTNFSGAFKSKDKEITADLLNNELAGVIVKNKKGLKQGFNEVGIKLPKNPTEKDYVNAIVDNGDNRRVCVMLAYYITEKNKKELEKTSNVSPLADADKIQEQGAAADTSDTASSGGTVGAIAGALGSVFGFLKSSKEAKAQKEANRAALLASLMAYKTAKAGGTGGSNTIWWVIGGIVVVGGLIGMYFYFKSKGEKAPATALGSGGEVPNPTPPAPPTPSTQNINIE